MLIFKGQVDKPDGSIGRSLRESLWWCVSRSEILSISSLEPVKVFLDHFLKENIADSYYLGSPGSIVHLRRS